MVAQAVSGGIDMDAVKRFFADTEFLYGIFEDGTLRRWKGDDSWEVVPTRETRCPHCQKLLEPHICKEDNMTAEEDIEEE